MCGIIGYVGENAAKTIVSGLKRLEYRGYDSSGIAVQSDKITVVKSVGRVEELEKKGGLRVVGNTGIGHTRWATHGKPSTENAHPFLSYDGRFAVVHNGIIENHLELKRELLSRGVKFSSETDSEIIAHLIAKNYDGNLIRTLFSVTNLFTGWFAIAVISTEEPDKVFAFKNRSPLIVGQGGKSVIASDVPALFGVSESYYAMRDGECAVIGTFGAEIYTKNGKISPLYQPVPSESWSESLHSFPHFTLKEIFEQPEKITLAHEEFCAFSQAFPYFAPDKLKNIEKIDLIGCGSAYYACVAAAKAIERIAKIPTTAHMAGEYRYGGVLTGRKTLSVAVSQSGETADTVAAIQKASALGSPTLAVVNSAHSTLSRSCDFVLNQRAGVEIAVATTKGYLTQVYLLYLFAERLARCKNLPQSKGEAPLSASVGAKIAEALALNDQIKSIAALIKNSNRLFFIGRGADYAAALEGALKIKEIAYLHAEAYAASELKHGAIALIENRTPVVALSTQPSTESKMLASIREVKTRGARVFAFTTSRCSELYAECETVILLPDITPTFSPLVTVPALQLLAYHTAVMLGNDVDKPRNLAKSVTVE